MDIQQAFGEIRSIINSSEMDCIKRTKVLNILNQFPLEVLADALIPYVRANNIKVPIEIGQSFYPNQQRFNSAVHLNEAFDLDDKLDLDTLIFSCSHSFNLSWNDMAKRGRHDTSRDFNPDTANVLKKPVNNLSNKIASYLTQRNHFYGKRGEKAPMIKEFIFSDLRTTDEDGEWTINLSPDKIREENIILMETMLALYNLQQDVNLASVMTLETIKIENSDLIPVLRNNRGLPQKSPFLPARTYGSAFLNNFYSYHSIIPLLSDNDRNSKFSHIRGNNAYFNVRDWSDLTNLFGFMIAFEHLKRVEYNNCVFPICHLTETLSGWSTRAEYLDFKGMSVHVNGCEICLACRNSHPFPNISYQRLELNDNKIFDESVYIPNINEFLDSLDLTWLLNSSRRRIAKGKNRKVFVVESNNTTFDSTKILVEYELRDSGQIELYELNYHTLIKYWQALRLVWAVYALKEAGKKFNFSIFFDFEQHPKIQEMMNFFIKESFKKEFEDDFLNQGLLEIIHSSGPSGLVYPIQMSSKTYLSTDVQSRIKKVSGMINNTQRANLP